MVGQDIPSLAVGEFIAALNQTLDFAYPFVKIHGEVVNFRVQKNKWVYFSLRDETGETMAMFASVYALRDPIENGSLVEVSGSPKHHALYGFSFQVQEAKLKGDEGNKTRSR
jgi:exodeoxyribonuclease VII large subunit